MDELPVNLRTWGDLWTGSAGWYLEGQQQSAEATRKWASVCAPPLLPLGHGRLWSSFVLADVIPGPLHLFLSFNEVSNFAEKTVWPDIKNVFEKVAGVQVHVYQGKVGNYQGPEIHKIFRNLDKLEPHMSIKPELKVFYHLFVAFKEVAHSVFGEELKGPWRERLHTLKYWVHHLNSVAGMPITPKLHILTVHVEQWVDIYGRSLGREGEQAGEAVHHIWKRLLESLGEPKKKESPAWVSFILKALLMFNANNT